MKRMFCGSLLLLAASVLAQQSTPPTYPPPGSTPPTFPEQTKPGEPPAEAAPPDQDQLTPAEAQARFQEKLKEEPKLDNAAIDVSVTDDSVVLSGTVRNKSQRDLALRTAQKYAANRHLVNKLEIRPGL